MAFIQQQRRPQKQIVSSGSEEEEKIYLKPRYNSLLSDSDTDWHILSSCSTSPILFPSETEKDEDNATTTTEDDLQTYLPSHDGTGTFLIDHSSEEEEQVKKNSFIATTAGPSSQQLVKLSETTRLYQQKMIHNSDNDPGSAISIFWDTLKKFKNQLLENDARSLETFSSLMSEAVFEGCIPFGSHLHMEFDNTLCTSSFFEK